MKRVIVAFISAFFLVCLVGSVVLSCSRSTILDMYQPRLQDTSTYVPRTKADTTAEEDTAREPISFTVTIEGWGNDINLN